MKTGRIATSVLLGIDDEPMFLPEEVWTGIRDKAFDHVKFFHKLAQSTEDCYLFEAAGHNRVVQIRGRIFTTDVKRLAEQIQHLLASFELPTPTVAMLTLLATDFNRSLIVTKDAVKPWDKFIRRE